MRHAKIAHTKQTVDSLHVWKLAWGASQLRTEKSLGPKQNSQEKALNHRLSEWKMCLSLPLLATEA